MKTKVKFNTGWFYAAECGSFGGFWYHDDPTRPAEERWPGDPDGRERVEMNSYGPFKTFGEAKRDAVSYFRCYVDEAFGCISDVRNTRKPRRLKG